MSCIICDYLDEPSYKFDCLKLSGEFSYVQACIKCANHMEEKPDTHTMIESDKKNPDGSILYYSFPKDKINNLLIKNYESTEYN